MQLKKESFCEYGSFSPGPSRAPADQKRNPGPLAPRAFDLLLFLVRNQGRLLSAACFPGRRSSKRSGQSVPSRRPALRSQSLFFARFWVKEGNLRYIETIPKRGYRVIASVREVQGTSAILLEEGSFSESRVEPVWLAQLSTRLLPRLTMVEKTGMILPPPLQVR